MKDKKLMCPWCYPAVQMVPEHQPNKVNGICGGMAWFECPVCLSTTPVAVYGINENPEEAAYKVATAPRIRPSLTADEIMNMDDMDAIWSAYDDTDESKNKIGLAGAIEWKDYLRNNEFPNDPILFAARPTDADIVVARVARAKQSGKAIWQGSETE